MCLIEGQDRGITGLFDLTEQGLAHVDQLAALDGQGPDLADRLIRKAAPCARLICEKGRNCHGVAGIGLGKAAPRPGKGMDPRWRELTDLEARRIERLPERVVTLSCRRGIHGRRHLGDLCAGAGPKTTNLCAWRRRAGLCRPHHWARRLQAGHANVSRHASIGPIADTVALLSPRRARMAASRTPPAGAERPLWAEPNRKEWSLRAAIKHHFAAGLCPTESRITQVRCCPTNGKPVAGVPVGHYVLGSPAY